MLRTAVHGQNTILNMTQSMCNGRHGEFNCQPFGLYNDMSTFLGCIVEKCVIGVLLQGVKLHDRAHDIHMQDTFMKRMLPLLCRFVVERHTMPLTHTQQLVPLSSRGCAAHKACGPDAAKVVDFSLCNAYGPQLSTRIDRTLSDMLEEHVFDYWLRINVSGANLYGGHEFAHWSPT
jgi:hypothetical protein